MYIFAGYITNLINIDTIGNYLFQVIYRMCNDSNYTTHLIFPKIFSKLLTLLIYKKKIIIIL